MKFTITKSIALVTLMLSATAVHSQIKVSKVANGTRTSVKSGDKVDIKIGGDEMAIDNIVVEIDIAAFKKTYKYDLVGIYYKWNGRIVSYYEHEFDSQLNTKKYGGKGVVPVYLYNTKNFKETDYQVLSEGTYYSGPEVEKTREIVIEGYYITGEEGYFDYNDNYKTRNTYSRAEPLMKLPFNAVFSAEVIAEHNLIFARNTVSDLSSRFDNDIKWHITQYLAPYINTPMYGALADGFQEVWDAKAAAVMAESDAGKAVAALEQLSKDYELMKAVAQKDKSILKAMNKEIKAKTSIDQKWELIKANA
jgi:hypothetical protein